MTTYDIYKIANLLIPTVGFRQTVAKKEYLDLDATLIPDVAQSQIYANSLSEMFMSVKVLSNTLEFDEGNDVDTWLIGTAYTANDRVSLVIDDRTYVWVAVVDNTGNDPSTDDGTNWKSSLSDRLEKYRQSAALEAISNILASQMNKAYSKELGASTTIYKENSTAQAVQMKSRFVGISIVPLDADLNRVVIIDKLGMRITGAQADLTVYLFHSSKKAAIQTFTIALADQEIDTHKWYSLADGAGNPAIIDYFNQDYNQGGVFYLGVFESDLVGNAQSYKYNEVATIYSNLNRLYSDDAVLFSSVEIANSNLNGTDLPTLGQYYDATSWNSEIPFNLNFRVEQSFYPQLEKNLLKLQKVYQYTLVFMLLKAMMQNDRINKVSDNAQNKIHELLFGDPANDADTGLQGTKEAQTKKLVSDLDAMFDDFKGLVQGAI